ncbi:hypothetical protein AVEN_102090-1 [Araneus ventricosus]|uniref:Tc1-like transposase DDE domain-containing protein n=1 Tax=Araneus ventricosus TaxID=182803 RepID=A0A4Y2LNB6_ARAVE|nr:hypothetical protein AVEN_102090-1 [Araneus ventricosus]
MLLVIHLNPPRNGSKKKKVSILLWESGSPDLNPMENLWRNRNNQVNSIDQEFRDFIDHRHRINEDSKDGVSYENLVKKHKSSKSGTYYMYQKYETTGLVESKRGLGRKLKTRL